MEVQQKARETGETVKSRMREQVGQRSTQAGEQIGSTAQALRSTSEKLREEGQDGPARAAERLAHHTERAGSYLRDSDADRILRDAEDFGRRRPLAVLAGGLVLGFAASRMLKASSRSRYEQGRQQGWSQQPVGSRSSERIASESRPSATAGDPLGHEEALR